MDQQHKYLLYGGGGIAAVLLYLHYRSAASAAPATAIGTDLTGSAPDTSAGGVLQYGPNGPVGGPAAPAPNPAATGTPDISAANKLLVPLPAAPAAAPATIDTPNTGANSTYQKRQAQRAQVIASRQQGVPTVSQAGPFGYIALTDQIKRGGK